MGTQHATYKQRIQVHTLRDLGWTITRIAQHLNLTETQVQYLIHQPITPQKRPGRPKKLTTPRRHQLIDFITSNSTTRKMPYIEVANALDWDVSEDTIRQALSSEGFFRRVARIKPYLSPQAQAKHLQWAKEYEHWTKEDWGQVLGAMNPL